MLPTRMRRLPGFLYIGLHRDVLTFCTFHRDPLFIEHAPVEVVRSQILRAAAECSFDVLAYCFMPDHVHLLVEGTALDASLSEFVKRAKQHSGYHVRSSLAQSLWQAGYHERVLREGDDTRSVVAYILNNPVRAGLVKEPLAYPFSGSGRYSVTELLDFLQTGGL